MADREKVIKDLEECLSASCRGFRPRLSCPYNDEEWNIMRDALALLKEQEARELTMDEWREWKTNKKRDPICKLWEYDTSPMWVLNPNDVHEPAFLMGKLKLFTGKPTFEQCKAVKWDEKRRMEK